MAEYLRRTVVTQHMVTECAQCRKVQAVLYVSDGSIAKEFGMTELPTASMAHDAIRVWEESHKCLPTTDELLKLMGLN
jgi:hypothetical protein